MRARRLPTPVPKPGFSLLLAALAAVAACDPGDETASMEGESLPWLAALADEALSDFEGRTRVAERPRVEVVVMPGLPKEHAVALGMVPGAADREDRPRYVLKKNYEGRDDLPPMPPEDEPPAPLPFLEPGPGPNAAPGEGRRWQERVGRSPVRLVAPLVYRGPWTLTLDAIEVDTESRKVAVFGVSNHSPPYIEQDVVTTIPQYNFKNQLYDRESGFAHYRVEGTWDGRKWVADVKGVNFAHGVLDEYWPLYNRLPPAQPGTWPLLPHPIPGRPWQWVRMFEGSP